MLDPNADALQKYLAKVGGVSGASASALVVEATADPTLHVFGELLDAPTVAALASTAHASSLALLRLFAYGSYADYQADPGAYPAFSDAHARKLRRLSVVALANKSNMITYADLRANLAVSTVREVEDVVLDAVYAGLLAARLDQRAEVVEVVSAVGRDVDPAAGVGSLREFLDAWSASAEAVVATIDENLGKMQRDKEVAERERTNVKTTTDNLRAGFSTGSLPSIPGRERAARRGGAAGAGASADGWRLGRSIRSRFEM